MASIKALRQRTGAGILDCKKALVANDGQIEAAIDWLRAKGIAKAAKRAGRSATEGTVHAYIHGGGQVGVLIEVNCETDFVARTDTFKELVHDLALQIAAGSPEYVSIDEIPAAARDREAQVQRQRLEEEGAKPDRMPQERWDMIQNKKITGRMDKWHKDVCLLDQPFIKDDKITVRQLLEQSVATIGENIQVRRFVRFALGEGLVKKADNLAAEVAAMTQQAAQA